MAYNPKDKNPSGVVLFGNNGSDQVFESVTDFVYDTGNTRLGINTSSPQYTLDVSGTGTFHTIRFADGTEMITSGGGGGGGGTPAGSDTEVQFNDGGAFGADANFTYDKTNTKLSVIGPYSTGFLATGVTEDAEENLIQFKSTNDADSLRYLFRYTRDGKLYLGQNGSYDIRTYLGGTNSSQNELRVSRDGLSSFIGLNPFGKTINIDGGGGEYLQFDSTTSLYNDTSHTFGMRNGSNPYGLRIYASGNTTNYARLSIQANTSDYNYEISPQVNNGVAGSVVVTNDTSSQEILVVKGAASQSANLQEWRNSSDTELASVGPAGRLYYQSSYSPISDEGTASSFTFDLDTSNVFSGTLNGATTLATSNGDVGQRFLVRLKQDGTGGRTVGTWFGNRVSWPGGSAPTLSSSANLVDLFGFLVTSGAGATLYYDGFTIATGIQ